MQIGFTGRHMEVTPKLRQYTEEHLRKLSRLVPASAQLHVILAAQRHLRTAEVTLKIGEHTMVGVGETADALASIKIALEKLERQVVRWRQRRRTQKRRPKPTTGVLLNVLESVRADHRQREVVERERLPLELLDLEEAIASLEKTPTGIVVFRNAETARVNVVYRRPDGRLGLIEPEP